MVENFLALHVTGNCQLSCKHCYCGNSLSTMNEMPLEILKNLCADFISTEFPLTGHSIILSGGEPLLHSRFEQLCDLIREFQDHVILSTNGILIPKYVEQGVFEKKDGIQVSVDGDRATHDRIRGTGSYDKAVEALACLQERGINHSLGFMLCRWNFHCIDHVIELYRQYECSMLNFGLYQPFKNSNKTVRFSEWVKAKEYVSTHTKTLVTCVETGCVAGIYGVAVTPDLKYWDCPRHQKVIGRYPQPIQTLIKGPEEMVNPFETCCKYLGW